MFTVFGFYKFKKIKNLKKFKNLFESELSINKVRGTIILSSEGINGTLSGKKNSIQKIAKLIKKKIKFIKFDSSNYSLSRFQPFHRERVKIRQEVVPIGLKINTNN